MNARNRSTITRARLFRRMGQALARGLTLALLPIAAPLIAQAAAREVAFGQSPVVADELVLPPPQALPPVGGPIQILRVSPRTDEERTRLLDLEREFRGAEIWSDDLGAESLDLRATPQARAALEREGFQFEVVIADLEALYAEYFRPVADEDFFDRYQSYDEHLAFMQDLAARFPDLATVVDLGKSVEGRNQWAIRITGPDQPHKPAVLYHGAQHGNEITGPPVIAYTARHLLENYGVDPRITKLVDGVEWFLLPIMNPDGYQRGSRYNSNGSDLNRNWGGPGARTNPFSQPETDNLRRFMETHRNLKAYIDIHTYGYYIMWPWGHTSLYTQDNPSYKDLGDRMAELIRQHRGESYDRRGPIHSTIYPVSGGSNDYAYGIHEAFAVTFELGDSYMVPEREIRPTCIEILSAVLHMSEWVSDCNQNDLPDWRDIARGTSRDCNENDIPDECESQQDCNGDRVLDVCDFFDVPDCNGNAIPDSCDISSGQSRDRNHNGIPDVCEDACRAIRRFKVRCKRASAIVAVVEYTRILYRPDIRLTLDGHEPRWVDADTKTKVKWHKVGPGEHVVRIDVCSESAKRVQCE